MISGPKVDLYVGPNRKYYNLPKLLLCHYSDFFESCFNGGFVETLSQKLELPEDKVEDFEILLEFMLRGTSPGSMNITEVGKSECPCYFGADFLPVTTSLVLLKHSTSSETAN
jgi:hypothetical protein